jgi:hypothetical protein
MVVIDVDGAKGRASLADLERQGLALPQTLAVTTGREDGGTHYYYRAPAGVDIRNDQDGKIGSHIDVRGTGGFAVVPPSIHVSGKQYRFVAPDAPIAELPSWIVERLTERPPMASATAQAGPKTVGTGSRTKTLVSLTGTMLRRGMGTNAIEAALLAENADRFSPPLSEAKVRSTVRDVVNRYSVGESALQIEPERLAMTAEEASRITGDLLEECRAWILRYIVVSEAQAVILAAWILHTYVFNAAETTPYIHITAPEKACGKSRLMEVLIALAATPIHSGGMTAAALVRTIHAKKPTIFLDEMDAQLGGSKEYVEALRGILNEGFRKGGVFHKCVGKNFDLREFDVYCPKCFAGIGRLPDTVSSRSIVIEMRRKLPGETVEPIRQKAMKAAAAPIRTSLEAWAAKGCADLLQGIEPTTIASLSDRQNDLAEPLLSIAQLASDKWLQRLTEALQTLFRATGAEESSMGTVLLTDIRSIFDALSMDQLSSKALAKGLCNIEGRSWAEWSQGKPLSPNSLARQLKKFKIYPQTHRFGKTTDKGYRRGDFEDAWARYCLCSPIPIETTSQPASLLAKKSFSNRNGHSDVTASRHGLSPHKQRVVTDVTDEIG